MERGRHWTENFPPADQPADVDPVDAEPGPAVGGEQVPERRRRWIVAAVLAPVGIAAGLGAAALGEHVIRGSGGINATPAPPVSTTTLTATPTDTAAATTTAPTTTTTAGRLPPAKPPVLAAGHPITRAPAPPPPPPPDVPGGPSLSLSQGADCIQVGATNHVESRVTAPAGLSSVSLQVLHSTDGTTYNGPMDFDGSNYVSDVGPFNDYSDVQTVTWTVTVTDALGRTAQAAKQFAVAKDPCS